MFSVIVPFRNAERTIAEAARSVIAQDLPDWEALFVDDGSSDGSAAILRALDDPRIRILSDGARAARGVAQTRNTGIRAAKGRFIAFLDADDLWLPQKLSHQHAAFATGAGIVFSSYLRFCGDKTLGVVHAAPRVRYEDALSGNPIGCLTGAFDTAVHGRAQMPDLAMHEDYAFWLSLLRRGEARGLPEVLAHYRVSAHSASANKVRAAMAVWDILGKERISPVRRIRGMAGYAFGALRRRL